MHIRYFPLWILISLVFPSLVHGSTAQCTLNGDSEIADLDACESDAIELGYSVKEIRFCPNLPLPSDIGSCKSWDVSEFEFLISRDSVTTVPVNRDLPAGTYRWMLLTTEPRRRVSAGVTFNRDMQGSSSAGKKCWTNGEIVNRGSDPDRETDRSKWSAECGDEFPSTISSNEIIYNDFSSGPSDFENSSDSLLPDGSKTVGYLLNGSGDLANSRSDVSNVVTLIELKTPIIVSGDPNKVGIFDITYDRSRGAEFSIDPVIGVNKIPRINHGTFTIDVDYEEITSD